MFDRERGFAGMVIHVHVPYFMLISRIDFVVSHRINPEIYFSAQDLDTCSEVDVKHVAHTLEQNRLEVTIHAPFMDLSPGGVDQKVKQVTSDRFLKTIEWAQFFKPRSIVFHPGYANSIFDGDVGLWLESSLETWRPLIKEAEKRDLVFAIENVYEETPDSLKRLLEEMNSTHFRFCFDAGHYQSFSLRKAPLSCWIETLREYLWEVHLHDNHGQWDEHLPIGEGGFDFVQFFSLLSKFQLNPIYTIEPHQEDHLWRGLEAAQRYITHS